MSDVARSLTSQFIACASVAREYFQHHDAICATAQKPAWIKGYSIALICGGTICCTKAFRCDAYVSCVAARVLPMRKLFHREAIASVRKFASEIENERISVKLIRAQEGKKYPRVYTCLSEAMPPPHSLSATTLQMLPAPFLFNCWRDREPWIIECGSKTRCAHAHAKQAALRIAVGGAPCAGAMRRVQSWVTVDLSAPK
jgi:hypothetical protein